MLPVAETHVALTTWLVPLTAGGDELDFMFIAGVSNDGNWMLSRPLCGLRRIGFADPVFQRRTTKIKIFIGVISSSSTLSRSTGNLQR